MQRQACQQADTRCDADQNERFGRKMLTKWSVRTLAGCRDAPTGVVQLVLGLFGSTPELLRHIVQSEPHRSSNPSRRVAWHHGHNLADAIEQWLKRAQHILQFSRSGSVEHILASMLACRPFGTLTRMRTLRT
jgi:hypothetical protein